MQDKSPKVLFGNMQRVFRKFDRGRRGQRAQLNGMVREVGHKEYRRKCSTRVEGCGSRESEQRTIIVPNQGCSALIVAGGRLANLVHFRLVLEQIRIQVIER